MITPTSSVASPAAGIPPPLAASAEALPTATDLLNGGPGRLGERLPEMARDAEPSAGADIPALFQRLPVSLIVSVPVREFRVKNLLSIAAGALIETQWNHGEDIPLASGDVQLAWSEFEVVDARLAVRVTRLT